MSISGQTYCASATLEADIFSAEISCFSLDLKLLTFLHLVTTSTLKSVLKVSYPSNTKLYFSSLFVNFSLTLSLNRAMIIFVHGSVAQLDRAQAF